MLPDPRWLRLFTGGLGESHPAELWQATATQQRAAVDHMHADHEQDPLSDAPIHWNPRWARAVACIMMPRPTGRDEPGGPGVVLWDVGFAARPSVGTEPTAPRPPGTIRTELTPKPGDWWLNWRLAERDLGAYQAIQTVTVGFQMRHPGDLADPPPPFEQMVIQTWAFPAGTEPDEHTRVLWSGPDGEGSLRLGVVGFSASDPNYDDDWELDAFTREVERVFLVVR